MKRIGDPSFFRIVDQLLAFDATRATATQWKIDDVDWQRERHSFSGRGYGFSVEVTTGTSPSPAGWVLMVVKEYWRAPDGESIRTGQWAHIEKGSRSEVVAWLEKQKSKLEAVSSDQRFR
ncbi:hypothetical protein BH11PSE3_BH11PSE3_36070 [soil metagenome]